MAKKTANSGSIDWLARDDVKYLHVYGGKFKPYRYMHVLMMIAMGSLGATCGLVLAHLLGADTFSFSGIKPYLVLFGAAVMATMISNGIAYNDVAGTQVRFINGEVDDETEAKLLLKRRDSGAVLFACTTVAAVLFCICVGVIVLVL